MTRIKNTVPIPQHMLLIGLWYYEALRQSSAGWETNENSYFPFILKEDETPTFLGGELRQFRLGGSPISFQDKASGGSQRRADESSFGARASRQVRRWRT